MKKRDYIESKIAPLTLGCYDTCIEKLSTKQIDRVLDELDYGDIVVYLNRKKHVVEKAVVDNELDLNLITAWGYESKYGRKVGQ